MTLTHKTKQQELSLITVLLIMGFYMTMKFNLCQ